ESILIVVDLPAPVGPSRLKNSPRPIENDTPSTAVTSPKVRANPWTSTKSSAGGAERCDSVAVWMTSLLEPMMAVLFSSLDETGCVSTARYAAQRHLWNYSAFADVLSIMTNAAHARMRFNCDRAYERCLPDRRATGVRHS